MKFIAKTPSQYVSKSFKKQNIVRFEFNRFLNAVNNYLICIKSNESEEHHKNLLRDFLGNTFYSDNYINTKENIDLAIFMGAENSSRVGAIFETKSIKNKSEMISPDNINNKAFHEVLRYYMHEREDRQNFELKHLVITNYHEFYIFDCYEIENIFHSTAFSKEYKAWKGSDTNTFYNDVAAPYIKNSDEELEYCYVNLREFEGTLNEIPKEFDKSKIPSNQINLFRLFSPETLLKKPFANDSNTLDNEFYFELLHVLGLEEVSVSGKKLITRLKPAKRNDGSMLENAIRVMEIKNKISHLENPLDYGADREEQILNVALELVILWTNRILFLKLLEAQLLSYHDGDEYYSFMNIGTINDFDEMDELFFEVLAKPHEERSRVKSTFVHLPHLNSSLFEVSELEDIVMDISMLKDRYELPIYKHTVLKDDQGKRVSGSLPTQQYFFSFLDSFDFSSDKSGDLKENKKNLINASVLGLIFEKINGYKEGSFFTPGLITMYMCRETIRRAALQKFKETNGWECKDIIELRNKIDDITQANEIVNGLRICDPAVGSGHFLVSALNEVIALKHDLGILCYKHDNARIREYNIHVENDELIITDANDDIYEYKINQKGRPVSIDRRDRLQETLFHEKKYIIENCMFGVDINPNSVNICRLRLWIELLKNAYYTEESDYKEMETLPNLDINIKCGNSLLSRFRLDDREAGLSPKQREIRRKVTIGYKDQVALYKVAPDRDSRDIIRREIKSLQSQYEGLVNPADKLYRDYKKAEADAIAYIDSTDRMTNFWKWDDNFKLMNQKTDELKEQWDKRMKELYSRAFEWRFEFPEVLDDDGAFLGFDAVVGNPPYIQLQQNGGRLARQLQEMGFETYVRTGDIYSLFYELGRNILKDQGHLSFITSNKWMRAAYGKATRKFFADMVDIQILIDLGDSQLFNNATTYTNIMLFQKAPQQSEPFVYNVKHLKADEKHFDTALKGKYSFVPDFSLDSYIILLEQENIIKEKINRTGTPIKDWDLNIYYGIKTGFNEAFIIDGAKKDELISKDPKSAEIIKPILRGRDIKRYRAEFADLWLITTFPALKIDIDKYPAVREYLSGFGKKIYQSGETYIDDEGNRLHTRKKTGNKWFETQDQIQYYNEFEKDKIMYSEIVFDSAFYYDTASYFPEATTFIITGKSLLYLVGILNSSLLTFAFKRYFAGGDLRGETFRYKKLFLESLPVIKPNEDVKKRIERLVSAIQSKKVKGEPTADEEKKIDRLVYELYGLSDEEISVVENS